MGLITLDNFPDPLQRRLEDRARQHTRSLQEEIVETLAQSLRRDADRAVARARISDRLKVQAIRYRQEGIQPMNADEVVDAKAPGRE